MPSRLTALTLSGSLLVAFVASAACDDGGGTSGPLTLDQYFQRLDEIDDKAAERFDRIGARLEEDLPEDEALDVLREVLPQQVTTLKDLLEGVEALEPPAEVKDAYDEALDALRDFIGVSEDTADRVAEAESFREVTTILNDQASGAASQRLVETCLALEEAAADHGIEVDLDCE